MPLTGFVTASKIKVTEEILNPPFSVLVTQMKLCLHYNFMTTFFLFLSWELYINAEVVKLGTEIKDGKKPLGNHLSLFTDIRQ